MILGTISTIHSDMCSLAWQMVIFRYVEDKDVFQKFYSKLLAKRLVQQNSASDDAEASMISKLKVSLGCLYSQGMN